MFKTANRQPNSRAYYRAKIATISVSFRPHDISQPFSVARNVAVLTELHVGIIDRLRRLKAGSCLTVQVKSPDRLAALSPRRGKLGAIRLEILQNQRRQSIGVSYSSLRQFDDLFGNQPSSNIVDRLEAQSIARPVKGQRHCGYHLRIEGLIS